MSWEEVLKLKDPSKRKRAGLKGRGMSKDQMKGRRRYTDRDKSGRLLGVDRTIELTEKNMNKFKEEDREYVRTLLNMIKTNYSESTYLGLVRLLREYDIPEGSYYIGKI